MEDMKKLFSRESLLIVGLMLAAVGLVAFSWRTALVVFGTGGSLFALTGPDDVWGS